ncbi:UNVERIFIED_CONTAM: TOM (translocase of outer membrane) complex component, partial [Siphonaria sp. JEL0065]
MSESTVITPNLLSPRNAFVAAISVAAVAVGIWILGSPTQKKVAKVKAAKSLAKSASNESIDDVVPNVDGKKKAVKKDETKATVKDTPVVESAPIAVLATDETKKEAPVADSAVPVVESEKDNETLAKEAKTIGNRLFGEKKYEEAIKYYTTAISLLPTDPVFFANRAACFSNLDNHTATISDCDAALALDPRYIKAVYRRAQAYTAIGDLEKALNDYTAICMLEEFKKESSITTTDRILKELGVAKAEKAMETKVARLPSETFVKAYMDSFRPKNFGASAYEAILAKDWESAITLVQESLSLEMSSDRIRAFALNTLGTFCFLKGDIPTAMQHLDTSLTLDPKNMNTLIKRASIFMERQDLENAVREYEKAESVSSTDPDLYYHRGQVRFLTGDVSAAIIDYQKSLELDSEFVYAHIQLAV